MQKIIILLVTLFTLSGCSYLHIHKMDIEQGNIITQDKLNRVHKGMTPADVKNIMGNPVLANVFDPNRLDYVYTFKPGYGPGTETFITYIFKNGGLVETQGNMASEFNK